MAGASRPWDDESDYIHAGPNSKADEWGDRWATREERLLVKSDRFEETVMGKAIKTGEGGFGNSVSWECTALGRARGPQFQNAECEGVRFDQVQGQLLSLQHGAGVPRRSFRHMCLLYGKKNSGGPYSMRAHVSL